jgi:hypothetical protein
LCVIILAVFLTRWTSGAGTVTALPRWLPMLPELMHPSKPLRAHRFKSGLMIQSCSWYLWIRLSLVAVLTCLLHAFFSLVRWHITYIAGFAKLGRCQFLHRHSHIVQSIDTYLILHIEARQRDADRRYRVIIRTCDVRTSIHTASKQWSTVASGLNSIDWTRSSSHKWTRTWRLECQQCHRKHDKRSYSYKRGSSTTSHYSRREGTSGSSEVRGIPSFESLHGFGRRLLRLPTI